jgi:hypothetical protein
LAPLHRDRSSAAFTIIFLNLMIGTHSRFVVVSAYTHELLPVELGQAPYLAKPMSEFELIEAVRRTLMSLQEYGIVRGSVREEPGRCLRI